VSNTKYYPIVTLTGPRQSGKTTLLRHIFSDYEYVSLEDTDSRLFARDDPRGFLNRYSSRVIFDEVQRVPGLFSYLQSVVDEDDSPGRFILSGSQNFLMMESVPQSLAGRTGVLHLLPLSRAELEGQKEQPLDAVPDLFSNTHTDLDLWRVIWTGFYPRIHDRAIPPDIWLSDYVQTYLQRDVRSLVNIGDLETFERFLRLVAGRAAQILNYSSFANDCGIAVDTAKRWISVLKTGFITFLLPPHYSNFNKRLIKSPKLYFYDTGLACYLLGIRSPEQLQSHPLRGALFENYVMAEVAKAYTHRRIEPPLYYWRDRSGHEVDLIIEQDGLLWPVEIKSGQTLSRSLMDGLRWWCRQSDTPNDRSILIYGGTQMHRQDEVCVRPWFSI
jgi:hypothetical protein